ncbi:MAG: transglycosylase domain-containing protein [Trueperaceae bacterium]
MRIVQAVLVLLLTGALSVASLLTASALKWAGELPSLAELDALEYTSTSQVFSSDGRLIGEILPLAGEGRETTNRIPVSLDDVSPAAVAAIVAYEDDRFFEHYGFDVLSLFRATYEEFFGDASRGGSTVTAQVIKNTVLQEIRSERSLERKVKEIMLGVELERRLTKAEILQRYVNVVFWGGNIYGIRSAAQAYFDKEPIELSLAESLYLARLIPAPNARHNDIAETRASMRLVLDRMVEQEMITSAQAEIAWLEPLEPRGWRVEYDGEGNMLGAEPTGEQPLIRTSVSSDLSPHVVLAVRNWLTDRYGESVVFGSGGFKVYTTIDYQSQVAANEASARAEVPPGAQLALVGLEPGTGRILAMVGEKLSADGTYSEQFNRVTQARRQPGSSFKPIVYATAIEQGGLSQATVLVDEPASFEQRGQPPYEPKNADNTFEGPGTVRYHLDHSRNIPAVKALEAASPEAVAQRARELGYSNIEAYYSLALGSFETTPLTHAAAFASFANGGIWVEPHLVARVEDAEGNVLYEADPREARVWSEQTAYIMLDALHGNVVDRDRNGAIVGYSWRAGAEQMAGRWIAGKTGTTNDERDIWFVGATPGMVAAAWIGNDDSTSLPSQMVLSTGASDLVNSSRQPIYAWRDFVGNALRGKPTADTFPIPDGIVFQGFDLRSGAPVEAGTRGAFRTTTDLSGQAFADGIRIEVPVDKRTGERATVDTPFEQLEIREVSPEELDEILANSRASAAVNRPGTREGAGDDGSANNGGSANNDGSANDEDAALDDFLRGFEALPQ